jgi:hypothetical protein
MGTPWGHLVYLLLRRAVWTTQEPASARAVIDDFTAEFGLIDAVAVFYRKAKEVTPADDKIYAASTGLRDAVFDACVADLTTTIGSDDPTAPTILKILWYLDDELWERLRAKAIELLEQSDFGLADLGARFVVIQPNAFGGGHGLHEFRAEEFKALVPKEEWAKYQVPHVEDDQVDVSDPSLPNKVAYAAVRLRKESESGDGQAG